MQNKERWFDRPAGPGLRLVLFAVIGAAIVVTLSGCGSIDTTRPDYTVRLFETDAERSRRHDMRMQEWRFRQIERRSRWKARHGIY